LNQRELALAKKIASACRIFYQERICESFGPEFAGHISVLAEKNRVLIPGHVHNLGRGLRDINPEDVIAVDLEGKLLEGKHDPVDEVAIHTSIYRARHDVKSVAHLHPPFATALSGTSSKILPISLKSCYFTDVPVLDTGPRLLSDEKSTAQMTRKLGTRNAIIHKGHGTVTVGESLEEACGTTLLLEGAARDQAISRQLGRLAPFERTKALKFAREGILAGDYIWRYYENKWKDVAP
jgi:ribulose-5-phosphate 4-epimerase/fuculose-1-phosphate aldolase